MGYINRLKMVDQRGIIAIDREIKYEKLLVTLKFDVIFPAALDLSNHQ